jgi:electron transfer flavoprotein alpha subunit/NAD-dependent dihydropyrimidine dehydrogenase PreA subunit
VGVIIDKDLCTGCEACVDECPFDALEMQDDKAQVNDNCTLCSACVEVCPVEAIAMPDTGPVDDSAKADYSGVWVYAEWREGELPEVVAELLGQARRLAADLDCQVGALIMGSGLDGMAEELFALGADKVYLADDERLARFDDGLYCEVMSRVIAEHKPEIVLAGATAIGRSVIPRVATQVGAGLTADCTGLAIDPETKNLHQTRPAFGGNIMATIVCPSYRPQMATVRPRVMKKGERREGFKGELIPLSLNGDDQPLTEVLEVVKLVDEQVNLTGAEVVVCGGRGLNKAGGFDLVRELASELGGVVGATRGAVDNEWIGHAHQVGQTGRTVAPKLYIALGVYGAVQHLVGMQGSETIIAVNTDPNAPIFQVATYGIVGDLYEVVPAMLEQIRQLRA